MAACKRLCDTSGIQSDMGSIVTDGLCCKTVPFDEQSTVEVSAEDAPLDDSFDIASGCHRMLSSLSNRSFHWLCDL